MRRKRNARSAELVWSAACELANQMLRASRRGLKFSPKVQVWRDRAFAAACFFGFEAMYEVHPEKAASLARELRRVAKAHPDKAPESLRRARKLERIVKRVAA